MSRMDTILNAIFLAVFLCLIQELQAAPRRDVVKVIASCVKVVEKKCAVLDIAVFINGRIQSIQRIEIKRKEKINEDILNKSIAI